MLASRTSCTNATHDGSFTGTATPLEQRRPWIVSSVADSASASAAFSTACQPPKLLVSGSVDMFGSWPGTNFTSAGLSACAENTTLAAGYRTPRISWFMSANTGGAVSGAGDCATSIGAHAASTTNITTILLSMA